MCPTRFVAPPSASPELFQSSDLVRMCLFCLHATCLFPVPTLNLHLMMINKFVWPFPLGRWALEHRQWATRSRSSTKIQRIYYCRKKKASAQFFPFHFLPCGRFVKGVSSKLVGLRLRCAHAAWSTVAWRDTCEGFLKCPTYMHYYSLHSKI